MKRFLMVASYVESLVHFRGHLLDSLIANGIEVHAASPDVEFGNIWRRQLEEKGVTVHEIGMQRAGMNPLVDLKTFAELYRLMRRIRPDIVMGYTIKPVIYGTLSAWISRVPRRFVLITGLGYAFTTDVSGRWFSKRKGLLWVARLLYRVALRGTHKVFFQNPDDQTLFRQLKLLSAKTSSHVVNGSGVDLVQYAVASQAKGPVRFLMIARLLGDKGVREYINAAQQVHRTHPQVTFALAGWIDDNPDAVAQQELDDWIAEGTVDYLGCLDDVRPAIAACHVYVLPSYREGTPRTVLEAMAMGRAVITSDAPGCRETVSESVNGYLVPVRDVSRLADAMRRFIDTPELIGAMGRKSREAAEAKYDVDKVNADILKQMGVGAKAREGRVEVVPTELRGVYDKTTL
ncbi:MULTISPECIES: glycosyltransferase family 4 protein [Halomonadaceae]|uniref:glycosyltransferase family 4 protein n=1 Tax=Halomonadaceae TaxID=28256 RepID=UPI001583C234|nr:MULTISPECIES: glycosyltransferase family 4 protein [Halomonas]MDI4635978.1 glycosyltransferase family 4 protein [Halomonas sp. BMC7]NUJ60343.1 glycosyltransferase family 4 protein [Halomonas taeanensis]